MISGPSSNDSVELTNQVSGGGLLVVLYHPSNLV